MPKTIVCFGPGPQFKGGISNYNTSLAKALSQQPNTSVSIVSWTQQYPAIIPREFIDKKSKTDFLEGTSIEVKYITNYNNPFTWQKTVQYIIQLKPDIVLFQWAIAIQGPVIGHIAHHLKRIKNIEIIFDLHFVIQKENSAIDQLFTKMALNQSQTFIAHALKTVHELEAIYPEKKFIISEDGSRSRLSNLNTIIKLYHPVYDLFKPNTNLNIETIKQELGLKKHVFLFFGFIRKYKGLHNCIKAFKIVSEHRNDVSLLICGESFWQTLDQKKISTRIKNVLFALAKKIMVNKQDDEKNYNPLALIKELQLESCTKVINEFIANEDVNKYFEVSDSVLLFYNYATPSGVESISYNFKMPILATKVGHFQETIKHGYNGYLAEAGDINSMAEIMLKSIDEPINRNNVTESAKHMSWANYAKAILNTDFIK